MAKSMTRTTRGRKKADPVEEVQIETVATEDDTPVVEKKIAKAEPAEYDNEDEIPCRSITSGELLMVGAKSNTLYKWADYGYVEYVQYQDLLYEIRSGENSFANYPRFVIMDDALVEKYPKLEQIYSEMYTAGDFEELLEQDVRTIKEVVQQMPKGSRESLKNYVATQIRGGYLDSINRIKALDEIFETKMASMLFAD